MFIHIIDKSPEKISFYYDGKLNIEDTIPSDLTSSIKYDCLFGDINSEQVMIAEALCEGAYPFFKDNKKQERYDYLTSRIEYYRKISQATYKHYSSFLLNTIIPESLLIELCQLKEELCNQVIVDEKPKVDNEKYKQIVKILKVINEIHSYELNIDRSLSIKLGLKINIDKCKNRIQYNPYGTITGRMGSVNGFFPILVLPKNARSIIKPNNDYLLSIDFNSAEIRTMLGLSGIVQPEEDIHTWHLSFVERPMNRDEVKVDFYRWFYGSRNHNRSYAKIYNVETIFDKHYIGNCCYTPFGRCIESDTQHALSYIIQSTTSDVFFNSVYNVWRYMKENNMKSSMAFVIHDNVVLDMVESERCHERKIKEIFSKTMFGDFRVNVTKGTDFGTLEGYDEI